MDRNLEKTKLLPEINIKKGQSGEIRVSFSYNPSFVARVKTIKGHRRHPWEKYWSFPNTDGTVEKILKVFEDEKIYINLALKVKVIPSPLVGEGKGEGYNFVDLRLWMS